MTVFVMQEERGHGECNSHAYLRWNAVPGPLSPPVKVVLRKGG